MTKKKTEKTIEKTPAKEDELILFEAVQAHPAENYVIVGALSSAGLLSQYRYEESVIGKEDIVPSITMEELDKHVKKFLGE